MVTVQIPHIPKKNKRRGAEGGESLYQPKLSPPSAPLRSLRLFFLGMLGVSELLP